jgi:DNA-binding CsgD family transcriptional regulator
MGLSPKQVAEILNVEAESVSMARVRVKKKLHLEPELSLHDFLLSV